MKAWDTVIVKADAASVSYQERGFGQPAEKVSAPHPHAGRAGVVQAVENNRDGEPVTVTVRFDDTPDGRPAQVVTVQASDVTVHHVL